MTTKTPETGPFPSLEQPARYPMAFPGEGATPDRLESLQVGSGSFQYKAAVGQGIFKAQYMTGYQDFAELLQQYIQTSLARYGVTMDDTIQVDDVLGAERADEEIRKFFHDLIDMFSSVLIDDLGMVIKDRNLLHSADIYLGNCIITVLGENYSWAVLQDLTAGVASLCIAKVKKFEGTDSEYLSMDTGHEITGKAKLIAETVIEGTGASVTHIAEFTQGILDRRQN